MTGRSLHDDAETPRTIDRRDDADRPARAFEHRPLLDMHL
jgi:hypothetical protein